MYVASGALRTSRIQEPKRRSASMAPRGADLAHARGAVRRRRRDVERRRRRAARRAGCAELGALGFAVDDVLDAFCVRVAARLPRLPPAATTATGARSSARSTRFANVRTAGRQGLFRYVFMDAAMRMGIQAAEQMLAGRRDGEALDAIGRSTRVVETTALTA